ncbi:MAG: M15 family metallopeptidase, partial [Candidatus Roizmanbacteria bacterium]|nr:M15 family metallopeptidase [Candidatus Roizmanbacteria bacterium]MCR4312909.1 M15 family metallopeptidase [Candidatus Roizmanbacteria bacterium]
ELNKSSVAKKYKINTIGAYIFRCNVNASTSAKDDLCSDGCVLSAHSFGIAVDINWEENCNGCSNYTMPMEIVDIFESYGFRWGGRYKSVFGSRIDAMHFEYMYDLCKDTQ